MTSASPKDETRNDRTRVSRTRRALGGASALLLVPSLLALAATLPSAPRAGRDADAVERASWAVGVSAGSGFRGVVDVELEAFRRGLRDGLAGAPHDRRGMTRPEYLARIRHAMKLLADAELATVAARIDESPDR